MNEEQKIYISASGMIGLFLIIIGWQLDIQRAIWIGLIPLSLCFIGLGFMVREQINEELNTPSSIKCKGDLK